MPAPAFHETASVLNRSPAQESRQGEYRVEIGDRHADLSVLGHRLVLGPADVRPAAQKIGGNADRDRLGHLRDGALRALQELVDHSRRLAHQDVHRVESRLQGRLKGRHGRLGAQQQPLRLLHVEHRVLSVLEQSAGDVVAALLDLDVLLGDAKQLLGHSHDRVGLDHHASQQDQRLFVAGLRREHAGARGLDASFEASPEVDLPGDRGAQAVLEVAIGDGGAIRR
jgi:hypothetical protein